MSWVVIWRIHFVYYIMIIMAYLMWSPLLIHILELNWISFNVRYGFKIVCVLAISKHNYVNIIVYTRWLVSTTCSLILLRLNHPSITTPTAVWQQAFHNSHNNGYFYIESTYQRFVRTDLICIIRDLINVNFELLLKRYWCMEHLHLILSTRFFTCQSIESK